MTHVSRNETIVMLWNPSVNSASKSSGKVAAECFFSLSKKKEKTVLLVLCKIKIIFSEYKNSPNSEFIQPATASSIWKAIKRVTIKSHTV